MQTLNNFPLITRNAPSSLPLPPPPPPPPPPDPTYPPNPPPTQITMCEQLVSYLARFVAPPEPAKAEAVKDVVAPQGFKAFEVCACGEGGGWTYSCHAMHPLMPRHVRIELAS
jgi:hypothetical protein